MAALPLAQAKPAAPRLAGSAVGDSGSSEALRRLHSALADLRAQAVVPMLMEAVACLKAHDIAAAAAWADKALSYEPEHGYAWYISAIAREKTGDLGGSLLAYEKAISLLPDAADVTNDLGRLAYRLQMLPVAEKLFNKYLVAHPGHPEGVNNLACVLRDQMRYGEAIELLRPSINADPDQALLWNTLGTVCTEQGEMEQATLFYDEALRIDPAMTKARYNRANARLALGDPTGALTDVDEALSEPSPPDETAMMRMARATMLIAAGDLERGWPAYEARLDPHYVDATTFMTNRPRWTPADDLTGRRLLLIGEQGLGDEVMFSKLVPDVLAALGPTGALTWAVEPRLVALCQRSFPTARVEPHATFRIGHQTVRAVMALGEWEDVDLWAPLGSLLARFRPAPDAFPAAPAFLRPDPERVAHWGREMAALGPKPKVGGLWKSLKMDSARARYFSPFEQWRPVLTTPDVTFVNLQYGDCAAELAQAQAKLGVTIHTPGGIDLKDDLDDVAALTCALNLVIGPANATTNLAGACGAPVWLISTPGAWPRLGVAHYPWYPSARVFAPPAYNCWAPVMKEIGAALRAGF